MSISHDELIELYDSRQYLHDADSHLICELVQEILTLRRSMEEILPLMDRIVGEECGVQPCYSKAIMTKMKIRKSLPKDLQEAQAAAEAKRNVRLM
jgi:hypothetical protein